MRFEVHTQYTREATGVFQRLMCKTTLRGKMLLVRGIYFVGSFFMLLVGVFFLTEKEEPVMAALAFVLAGLCGAFAIFYYRFMAGSAWRRLPAEVAEITFSFGEEELTAQNTLQTSIHPYQALYGAAESRDYFVVFLTNKVGYILNKNDFTLGNPEQFRAFIQEKTGKEVRSFSI